MPCGRGKIIGCGVSYHSHSYWLLVVSPCLVMQPLFASIKYNLSNYLTLVAIATNFFCFVDELHVK